MARHSTAKEARIASRIRAVDDGALLPPLTESELKAVESGHGFAFPQPFRDFLRKVSAGEPVAGAATLLDPRSATDILPVDPVTAFPYEVGEALGVAAAAAAAPGTAWLPHPGSPSPGVWPLVDQGCDMVDCLVVTGPCRGTVWQHWDQGWTPHATVLDGEVCLRSVGDWLATWLLDLEQGLDHPIDPDTRDIRLIHQGLASVPFAVWTATAAEELVLSSNALTEVPPTLGTLTSLRRLLLGSNRLRSLPTSIGRLEALEELVVSANELRALPPSIGALRALRQLDASRNPLEHLPEELGACESLAHLELSRTHLTRLPDTLAGLRSLESLGLEGTPIEALPEGLAETPLATVDLRATTRDALLSLAPFAGLRELKVADLRLDAESLAVVAGLRSLQTLRLVRCELEGLPGGLARLDQLRTLQLDQNQLRAIPAVVRELPALETLVLFANPLDPVAVEAFRAEHPQLQVSWSAPR